VIYDSRLRSVTVSSDTDDMILPDKELAACFGHI